MVNNHLQTSKNWGGGEAETIKSTLFEGLLTSKINGRRFHYVREFGLDTIKPSSLWHDMQPKARALFQLLFRYNLQHEITPRGLRITITSKIWRIAAAKVPSC